MSKFKPGDTVAVMGREQTPADIKSGLYYAHYAGMTGTILKVYGEEASVLVDRESLPNPIRVRHEENEKAQRQRWLDGLSDEARNKLSASEKTFSLNYAILVAVADLGKSKPRPAEAAAAPKRLTEAEIAAKEAEFLASRKS